MEITLKLELSTPTLSLFQALVNGTTAPVVGTTPKAETPKAGTTAPKAETPKAGTTAPKAETPKADAKSKAASFEDLDEDAKLEAIKTEVTRHTKKGKSSDIKALLTHFGAARASELDTDKYSEFYDAIVRYGKGETVEAITGGEDDLN